MFAILALIDFVVAFVLRLTTTDTGDVDLLQLGLALLSAHFAWPYVEARRHPPA